MRLSRFAPVPVLTLLVLAACGSEVEPEPGTGGGGGDAQTSSTGVTDGPSSSSSGDGTGGQGTGGEGTGGEGGAPTCEPYDQECNCAECGGTCVQACNFSPEWECLEPGPTGEGEFSCGGWENCTATEACIHVEPQGDGCTDYFCAELPDECVDDPSCACLGRYTDTAEFDATCTEGEGIEVQYWGYANDPPWDAPWCGDLTCVGDEGCFSCVTDGGMGPTYWECSVENPSVPGIQSCVVQWTEPEGPVE